MRRKRSRSSFPKEPTPYIKRSAMKAVKAHMEYKKFIIIQYDESHKEAINALMERLKKIGYDTLEPCSTSQLVLHNGAIVGAFQTGTAEFPNSLRIFWLVVSQESENLNMKIGSFIIDEIINRAIRESISHLYISVNITHKRAKYLYEKKLFEVYKKEDKYIDMVLNLQNKDNAQHG